jgi:tetratricopeptide (TPR) repeat protein
VTEQIDVGAESSRDSVAPVTRAPATTSRGVPTVWGNVPQRNKNFTGREELLDQLRDQVTGDVAAVLAHALHGMGGVGKTQLAVEYAYRFRSEYDLVWWVPADQLPLIRSSLAALAPRLGLEEVTPGRVEDAVRAVLDALRRGEPYEQWLLIFDNADQPEDVREFLPDGPGHVVVTSRNHRWEAVSEVVEVDVFSRPESLDFLHRRVPGITDQEAGKLAEELGDLPLALEQAGALQVESGMSVAEYLELLEKESSKVLAENPPADYPVSVAAAWSLSVARLQEEMPFAWELLRRCAFFGPEPIDRDLLKIGRYVLGPPLRAQIGDAIVFGRATRELGRYALARVDNYHKTLQVHRLIQKLIRDDMEAEEARRIRHEVHLLLAAADPDEPDEVETWPRYDALLAHLAPSEAVECRDEQGRRLVRNVVRYLFNVGELPIGESLSQAAMERWTQDSGPDDIDVLVLARQRANLLWARGAYRQAYELRKPTLDRMRSVLGEEHEETLAMTNGYGADLRARGDFAESLALYEDTLPRHKRVFGEEHPQTFNIASNLAEGYGLVSRYEEALATDRRTHDDRLHFYGRDDNPWVVYSLGAIGRDLRQVGRYQEALEIAEQARGDFVDLVRQRVLPADHLWVLWQAKDLSVTRRKAGRLREALDLAEEVYDRFIKSFGETHPDTLAAGMNLGNAQRVFGSVHQDEGLQAEADRHIEEAYQHYGAAFGDDHPFTWGCGLNLAIVRLRRGDERGARQRLEEALAGLEGRLGDQHHYTLTCMTALATALAATGNVEQARSYGERAYKGLRVRMGPDHPHTLACGSNLALDLAALGEPEAAEAMASDVIARYRQVLPDDHLDVRDATDRKRIALDFEPPNL